MRALPQVGGLFNPSLEAIVSLAPTFVTLVPSAQQRELHERLAALGIEVLALPNISYEEVLRSIVVLGERVGRGAAGRARADAIRASWGAARAQRAGTRPLRAVLVLQREPLYVVGPGSFLDAMLEAAGAENLARSFGEPYPRVSVEWLIAAAPELILDAANPAAEARAQWSTTGHRCPHVACGRVHARPAASFPGPTSTARSRSSPIWCAGRRREVLTARAAGLRLVLLGALLLAALLIGGRGRAERARRRGSAARSLEMERFRHRGRHRAARSDAAGVAGAVVGAALAVAGAFPGAAAQSARRSLPCSAFRRRGGRRPSSRCRSAPRRLGRPPR